MGLIASVEPGKAGRINRTLRARWCGRGHLPCREVAEALPHIAERETRGVGAAAGETLDAFGDCLMDDRGGVGLVQIAEGGLIIRREPVAPSLEPVELHRLSERLRRPRQRLGPAETFLELRRIGGPGVRGIVRAADPKG